MNKVRLLSIISVGLLLANLVLLWFLLSNKPKHDGPGPNGGPRNIIIKKLDFDENQIKQYESLIQWHRSEIDKSQEQIVVLKNKLYSTLLDSSATTKDGIINEIGAIQQNIENIHYKHFQDIKNLCKPDQLVAFEKLSKEIAALFAPPHPPKRPE